MERGDIMLAKQLRYLLQSKELSQVQLAEKLGVKKQSVSNWENDNVIPSVEMLERIAEYFNVSTDYLLGRENSSNIGRHLVDVTGLSQKQIEHIVLIIEDFRENRNF